MKGTHYLDLNYLAYNIIRVKYECLGEKYTTYSEVISISKKIEEEFSNEEQTIYTFDEALSHHVFEIDEVIKLRGACFIDLDNFKYNYKTFSSNLVKELLENDKFIKSKLVEFEKDQIKKLKSSGTKIKILK